MPSVFLANSFEAKSNPSIIRETDDDVTFRAILQDGDVQNRNRKIYPTGMIDAALNDPLLQEALQCGTWYGEAGHPFDTSIKRQLYTDFTKVSHAIMKLDKKGNLFYGDLTTTVNQNGSWMKKEVDKQKVLSFSMRGLHKLKQEQDHFRVVNLKITTYDWVPVPSHARARMVSATESVNPFIKLDDIEVTEEQLKEVLGSEGINSLFAVEDMLGGKVETAATKNGVIQLKGGTGMLSICDLRSRTFSVLDDVFGG